METQPPPLSAKLADLQTAISADANGCLPASVHALIMACLARIFAQLEQLLRLWQSGALPLPAPRDAGHPIPAHPPVHRPSTSARRTRRATIRARITTLKIRTAPRAPNRAIPRARSPAITPSTTPSPRRHRARAPPTDRTPIRRENPSQRGRENASILLRYRN